MTDLLEPTTADTLAIAGADHVPVATARDLTGTGYDRPAPSYDKALMEVARGTPMGEYLRRYWHPVAISQDVKDLPIRVRIMGEDLVVFRDKRGRPGAVYERCAHRQASLFYGRVEEGGIRCCYHGWMFDVEGHCLNQPLETKGGRCGAVRQPWYPVEERYGLIFIYMGPPGRMPLLPRYACMENLKEGEHYAWTFTSLPGSDGHVVKTNWMINMDNIHDMGHALWLHELHSGPQFGPAFSYVTMENAAHHQHEYRYVETEHGMYSVVDLDFGDTIVKVFLETHMPNVRLIHPPILPGPTQLINWAVPVDDEHHYDVSLVRVNEDGFNMAFSPMADWDRSDPEVVQRTPSDFEAQIGQGPIPWHSEEHLVGSDRGVVMMRRQYHRQLRTLADGETLMNLRFGDDDPFIPTVAGAFPRSNPDSKASIPPIPPQVTSEVDVTHDVAGRWTLTMKTPMGDQISVLTLARAGASLEGEMTMPDGATIPLADGTVSGARATWKAKVKQPFPMTLDFDVAIDGDTMTGACKPGVFPAGAVTGRRN